MLFDCLLACIVSDKNSSLILIFVPFYLLCLFSSDFNFFSLLWTFIHFIMMSLEVVVCAHTHGCVLILLECVELLRHRGLYFSSNVGNLQPLFLQIFCLPLVLTWHPKCLMLDHLILYRKLLRLFSFFVSSELKSLCFGLVRFELTNLCFSGV